MLAHMPKRKPNHQGKPASLDKLIAIEWDIIKDLKKMLQDPKLSVAEKVHISNSIAYHAACLNKLLIQKGLSPTDDATLGDFIRNIAPRYARRIRVAYREWKRKLLSAT